MTFLSPRPAPGGRTKMVTDVPAFAAALADHLPYGARFAGVLPITNPEPNCCCQIEFAENQDIALVIQRDELSSQNGRVTIHPWIGGICYDGSDFADRCRRVIEGFDAPRGDVPRVAAITVSVSRPLDRAAVEIDRRVLIPMVKTFNGFRRFAMAFL